MKKILLGFVLCGFLFSFSPIAKAEIIQPSQQELKTQLIALLTQLIAQLEHQLSDLLAQRAIQPITSEAQPVIQQQVQSTQQNLQIVNQIQDTNNQINTPTPTPIPVVDPLVFIETPKLVWQQSYSPQQSTLCLPDNFNMSDYYDACHVPGVTCTQLSYGSLCDKIGQTIITKEAETNYILSSITWKTNRPSKLVLAPITAKYDGNGNIYDWISSGAQESCGGKISHSIDSTCKIEVVDDKGITADYSLDVLRDGTVK